METASGSYQTGKLDVHCTCKVQICYWFVSITHACNLCNLHFKAPMALFNLCSKAVLYACSCMIIIFLELSGQNFLEVNVLSRYENFRCTHSLSNWNLLIFPTPYTAGWYFTSQIVSNLWESATTSLLHYPLGQVSPKIPFLALYFSSSSSPISLYLTLSHPTTCFFTHMTCSFFILWNPPLI